jgi:hypothetical protein
MKQIAVRFGALAPKLHEQLGLPRRRMRYLQDCADGIVSLAVGGMLTDRETHRVRKRLMKRIIDTFPELSRRTHGRTMQRMSGGLATTERLRAQSASRSTQ